MFVVVKSKFTYKSTICCKLSRLPKEDKREACEWAELVFTAFFLVEIIFRIVDAGGCCAFWHPPLVFRDTPW